MGDDDGREPNPEPSSEMPPFIDVPWTAVGTAVQAYVSVHHASRVTAEETRPGTFRVSVG